MCIDYAKLYVSATEFYENEHDIQIDQATLMRLKCRALSLNSQVTSLSDTETQELYNIFLIVSLYNRDDLWENCIFCDEISQIRHSVQIN